jgi:hypothetical protein
MQRFLGPDQQELMNIQQNLRPWFLLQLRHAFKIVKAWLRTLIYIRSAISWAFWEGPYISTDQDMVTFLRCGLLTDSLEWPATFNFFGSDRKMCNRISRLHACRIAAAPNRGSGIEVTHQWVPNEAELKQFWAGSRVGLDADHPLLELRQM